MTAPAIAQEAMELITALHAGGNGWAGYWWTWEGKYSYWWPVGSPEPVPSGQVNVYFGVHPALAIPERWKDGRQIPAEKVRSTIADIAAVNCLFSEFDAKDYGDKAGALAHVQGLGLPPSVLVDSGGGFHAYWLLTQPFAFADQRDRERARNLQAAWVTYVGGDKAAKDLARVLRVPGTRNLKPEYGPNFPTVTVVQADYGRRYTLAELETACKPAESMPTIGRSERPSNNGHHAPSGDTGRFWLDKALGQARIGNRNATGFWLACQIRDAGITEREAESIMQSYARQVPSDSKGPYADGDALASMRQAYAAPPRDPAESAEKRNGTRPSAVANAPSRAHAQPEEPPAAELEEEPGWLEEGADNQDLAGGQPSAPAGGQGKQSKPPAPTDPELGYRWLKTQPNTAWGLGEFRRYEGGIWPVVPLDVIRNEILDVLEAAEAEGIRPTAPRLASVMELARIKIAKAAEVWDADHDTLVCSNGALHIPTRTLQPHSPAHYATSRLPFAYDPQASAPTWAYVLNCCASDAQDFLQEFAGYALTTETKYELAIWLAGQPGGGKSTILEGFSAMLGARVCLLGLADIEKSRFALTNLPGKTLAISTEQPGGYVATAQLLNNIISGEAISVDRKFRDPVTIIPRAKIAWALNELPRVGTDGAGLFRRVKVVNFPPIPEQDRDPEVKERVKTEGAGILIWALDGLQRLRERGRFEIPQSVQDATAHFRETNDVPALFVSECCLTGDHPETGLPYRTQGSVLYRTYSEWCKDNGHKPASSTSIAEDWRRLGFEKYLSMGKAWWRYVGLVDTGPQVSTTP